jgi:hypothetical protein
MLEIELEYQRDMHENRGSSNYTFRHSESARKVKSNQHAN